MKFSEIKELYKEAEWLVKNNLDNFERLYVEYYLLNKKLTEQNDVGKERLNQVNDTASFTCKTVKGDKKMVPGSITQLTNKVLSGANQVDEQVILLTLVVDIINNLHLGRKYCDICESYDHECGCNITVLERYRKQIIGYLTERVV